MPVENIRGVNIVYEIVGDRGPWVVLITGGRRAHDEFVPLAKKLANRVLFLNEGRTAFFGSVEEMEQSKEPIIREFLELDELKLEA